MKQITIASNLSIMDFFLVKLKMANAKSQFVDFDEWPTWDALSSEIVKLFRIPRDRVTITSRNAEKRFIDLPNDDALQELYKSLGPGCKFVKFVVQDSQDTTNTVSSTWSAGSHLSDLSKTGEQFTGCRPAHSITGAAGFQLLCWVFNTPHQPFLVKAELDETVDDLKKSIKRILDYPEPYFKLCLWKPSPSIPLSRFAQLAKFQSPEEIPGSDILGPVDALSQHFLSVPTQHLHIIVVAPLADNKGKRKAEVEPVEQSRRNSSTPENYSTLKRVKLDNETQDSQFPSEDTLKKYHETLYNVPGDPLWYSDPSNLDRLPFPFTCPVPERFLLQYGLFEYMGREKFQEVYDNVSSLKLDGFSSLYVYGTIGYGKSYILAALACLLYRKGKRVVFIPDCRAMIADPLLYIQTALLCTLANPSLKKERERIQACTSVDEVILFCRSLGGPLYFIVDQVNAFEKSPPNTDQISDTDKEAGQKLIDRLGFRNFLITSASANYQTARFMARKQTGKKKMSLMGGMSKEEMTQWWKHHESTLPKFEGHQDKMEIEDFTGRIPLLLRPLFQFGQRDFCEVEHDFRASSEIVAVELNIKEFSDERSKMGEQLYSDYIDALFNCLTRGDAPSNRSESFDYRYFYHTDITGECTCGAARAAAAVHIARWKISRFYESKWIDSLRMFKDNPAILGFQVEKICLACIADIGLNYDGKSIKPQTPIWFRGKTFRDLLGAIPSSDPSGLYLPLSTQFEDIDGLILEYDKKANTLNVIPIQVTINGRHKDSETLFYNKWKMLESKFPGVTIISTFIWITELMKSNVTIAKEARETRTILQVKKREHRQIYLTAEDVHKPLGEELKRIRELQNQD